MGNRPISTDQHTAPPVAPRSNPVVYTWRNGAYHLESFVPTPNSQSPGFLRPQIVPPELKQTSLVKNPTNLRRESLFLETTEAGLQVLIFEFDASEASGGCEVHMHFCVTDVSDAIPQFVPAVEPPVLLVQPQKFSSGLHQQFRSVQFNLLEFPPDLVSYSKDAAAAFPLVIQISSLKAQGSEKQVCDQFTYVSFSPIDQKPSDGEESKECRSRWRAEVLMQKLCLGGQIFSLYDVFGMSSQVSHPEETMKEEVHQNGQNGRAAECIICLSEPRDTTVLPCRHLCFCGHCAAIIRLQCDRCPICRQKVSSLLQFTRDGEMNEISTEDKDEGVESHLVNDPVSSEPHVASVSNDNSEP